MELGLFCEFSGILQLPIFRAVEMTCLVLAQCDNNGNERHWKKQLERGIRYGHRRYPSKGSIWERNGNLGVRAGMVIEGLWAGTEVDASTRSRTQAHVCDCRRTFATAGANGGGDGVHYGRGGSGAGSCALGKVCRGPAGAIVGVQAGRKAKMAM